MFPNLKISISSLTTIFYMEEDKIFSKLNELKDLFQTLVETNLHKTGTYLFSCKVKLDITGQTIKVKTIFFNEEFMK